MGALHLAMQVSMSIAILCSLGFAMRSAPRKVRVKAAVSKENGQEVKNDAPLGVAPGSFMEAAEKIEAKDMYISHTTQGCETNDQKLLELCQTYRWAIQKALRNPASADIYFKGKIKRHPDIESCTLEQAKPKCEHHWCLISEGDKVCNAFQNVVNGKVWERDFAKMFESSVNDLEETEKEKYMACTLDSFWRKCQIARPKRPCGVTPFCEEEKALAFFSSRRGSEEAMSKWISKHQYQECQNQKPRVIKRECQGSESGCFVNLAQVSAEYKLEFCSKWNTAPDKESLLDKMWTHSNSACYVNDIDKYCSQV